MATRKTTDAIKILDRKFFRTPKKQALARQTDREMKLGDKIRKLREKAGLTQAELAIQIGTGSSAISRIEDADYDKHSLETLRRVADALGMLLVVDFEPKPAAFRQSIKQL